MSEPDPIRTYLTPRLDQLAAAQAASDDASADQVIADLIADNNPGARAVIADALRLLAARDAAEHAGGTN